MRAARNWTASTRGSPESAIYEREVRSARSQQLLVITARDHLRVALAHTDRPNLAEPSVNNRGLNPDYLSLGGSTVAFCGPPRLSWFCFWAPGYLHQIKLSRHRMLVPKATQTSFVTMNQFFSPRCASPGGHRRSANDAA